MISHLNNFGFPISALDEIYSLKTGANKDAIDIKWRCLQDRIAILKILNVENILGWLSNQENTPPLEIFLTSEIIQTACERKEFIHKDYLAPNSLRTITLFPGENFGILSDKTYTII